MSNLEALSDALMLIIIRYGVKTNATLTEETVQKTLLEIKQKSTTIEKIDALNQLNSDSTKNENTHLPYLEYLVHQIEHVLNHMELPPPIADDAGNSVVDELTKLITTTTTLLTKLSQTSIDVAYLKKESTVEAKFYGLLTLKTPWLLFSNAPCHLGDIVQKTLLVPFNFRDGCNFKDTIQTILNLYKETKNAAHFKNAASSASVAPQQNPMLANATVGSSAEAPPIHIQPALSTTTPTAPPLDTKVQEEEEVTLGGIVNTASVGLGKWLKFKFSGKPSQQTTREQYPYTSSFDYF